MDIDDEYALYDQIVEDFNGNLSSPWFLERFLSPTFERELEELIMFDIEYDGKPTKQPMEQLTEKPMDIPIEQPTEEPIDLPIEQPTDMDDNLDDLVDDLVDDELRVLKSELEEDFAPGKHTGPKFFPHLCPPGAYIPDFSKPGSKEECTPLHKHPFVELYRQRDFKELSKRTNGMIKNRGNFGSWFRIHWLLKGLDLD